MPLTEAARAAGGLYRRLQSDSSTASGIVSLRMATITRPFRDKDLVLSSCAPPAGVIMS